MTTSNETSLLRTLSWPHEHRRLSQPKLGDLGDTRQVDLILTVLVVLLVGVASFASNGEVRRLPPQNAVRPSLPVETAPSLYEAAKPRVIPKRTEDWLDHWEIGEPSDVVQQRSETP